VAINFASYETLKQLIKTDGSETHAIEGLVMGGLSGTAAVTLTYPSDVLRRRMMMQGERRLVSLSLSRVVRLSRVSCVSDGAHDTTRARAGIGGASNVYDGLWDACVKIGREEGVAGFYRGLIPCYLKVVPAAAIGWACIETLQKVERDFLSSSS
jgi:solute carrier family 25 phosphate transporter 23/24/25/41